MQKNIIAALRTELAHLERQYADIAEKMGAINIILDAEGDDEPLPDVRNFTPKRAQNGREYKRRLSDAQVETIRERHASGESSSAIAPAFKVNRATIDNVVKRRGAYA